MQKKVEDALTALEEAKKVNPAVEISYRTWRDVCREGLLQDKDEKVSKACELYVKNNPKYEGKAGGDYVAKALQEIRAGVLVSEAQTFIRQEKVEDALAALEEAKKLHSAVKISDKIYADLCWSGVLEDKAQLVLEACEISANNNPEHGGMRDSRGVARAMTGNLEGVIQDFKHYVEWAPSRNRPQARIDRRKRWIEQLNNAQNPFSGPNRKKVIAELKDE
jgi:hypothetical protein